MSVGCFLSFVQSVNNLDGVITAVCYQKLPIPKLTGKGRGAKGKMAF